MGKGKTRWKTAAIPQDLYEKAEIVSRNHGYTSTNEFVKDAVRRRLEELEQRQPLGEVPA